MKTKGFWVIKTSAGGYWCSGGFDPQIRKAHVYTWKEKAEEAIEVFIKRKYFPDEITYEVIALAEPKELKDTEAEWIVSYLDGERNYVCSHCGYYALSDIGDQAFDSHFCPHCGRRMINSTQPWTERCM